MCCVLLKEIHLLQIIEINLKLDVWGVRACAPTDRLCIGSLVLGE